MSDTAKASGCPALGFTLMDATVQECPYDHYKVMRDEAPVYQDPQSGFFIVTRFEDVRYVLRTPEIFGNAPEEYQARLSTQEERARKIAARFKEKGWVPAAPMDFRDEPEHKQMRAMFDQAFRPSRIKEIDPYVESLAYDIIDGFLADGQCDWVRQFAIPYPLTIIGKQMGAKEEDIWKIKSWTDAFFHRIGLMLDEDQVMAAVDKEIEGQHYFQKIFEEKRANPDNTLISDLVNTVIKEWGRTLTDNELHAEMMADTFVGGSETTTNALAAGVMLLIQNPDVWQKLKSDPDKYLRPFLEEVLRLESPVQGLYRFAHQDTELHGVKIPRGAVVITRYGAANRDDRQFENPEKLDLDRPTPGAHLAFGMGSHHCLGAPLARRELYWGFKALVDRVEDMWFLEGKNDFSHHPHFLLRALKSLHIGFTPKTSPKPAAAE